MQQYRFSSLRDFLPRSLEIFRQGYSPRTFAKDLLAGTTVGIVALPLAMAFSIAAGGSPQQGLYTAIFAGFFISLLGGSRFQIGGPTGAFVVIIYDVVVRHGMGGLAAATVLAALMLIAMGFSGLGKLIKFIPYPVTTGFTAGIGVTIFSQQVKDFFGLRIAHSSPEFFEKWAEYVGAAGSFTPLTLAVGLGTVAVILAVRRFAPKIPGSVAGVAAATLLCYLFRLPVETVGSRFGGIPSVLPPPALPSFDWATVRAVFPDAVTIAILAAIESLLSAVVADGMTGDRHKANMELVAQGVGNLASALFGGIPATGAIARTATNIKTGAASPVSGMVHAAVLAAFVLFLSPVASVIPLASLSAVLMVVAWDMSDFDRFFRLVRRSPRSDAMVLVVTFILTVAVDLTVAVEVGVVLAAFLFLRRMVEVADIRPGEGFAAELVAAGERPATSGQPTPEHSSSIEVYEITGPFFFGVADVLQDTLGTMERPPEVFVLRMREVPAVDSTGLAALEAFARRCERNGTILVLSGVRPQPLKALEKAGLVDQIGRENVHADVLSALKRAEELVATPRN